MKILQIGMSYNPGGVESFVMNYYRQLATKGIQFDFVSMFPKLAYENEIKELGGRVFHISNVKTNPLRYAVELRGIVRTGQYDAVHINMLSAANVVPLEVAKACGVENIIAHSHNSSSPGIARNLMHLWNKKTVERCATKYFACSKIAGKWLFSDVIIDSPQFHVVNNAINLEKFSYNSKVREAVRKELSIENKFVIGHVGRFEEQKNHFFLIEIFEKIVELNNNATLVLVGDGELEPKVREKVQQAGIEEYVKFLGVRADVNRIWQAMDVFLLPSLFEGLPLVALEAQASGIPSVLSDTITSDVKLTDDVEFVSLKTNAEYWAERVVSKAKIRENVDSGKIYEAFVENGYEIKSAAEKMFQFYME